MNETFAPLLRVLLIAISFAAALPVSAVARSAVRESAPSTLDACSWDRPGRDPFMGDVVAAVDRYQDIPVDVRQRLKARMARRDYDDVVSIRRDSIAGRAKKVRYGSTIRDMHFGNSRLCHSVSRAAWDKAMQERGLVYCESGQCILVPTVCRNVSRIARAEVAHERAEGDEPELAAVPVATIEPDLPPFPVDAIPAAFAPDTDLGLGSLADNGPFAAALSGGPGSFAAGAGGAAVAAVAAASVKGDGFEHVAQAPSNAEVAGSVAAVPEPETWGLMIGGLVVLAARRRRVSSRRASAAGGCSSL
ncbi:MAG: MHFG family PEP-CTERM protein [Caldimonas sp.]